MRRWVTFPNSGDSWSRVWQLGMFQAQRQGFVGDGGASRHILACRIRGASVTHALMATMMSETESGTERGRRSSWLDWIAVLWIVGYALFFFHFTLPNSNPPRGRLIVWLELPDILWSNIVSPPDTPASSASSWSNLLQRLDLIVIAAAIWLGSWAVGSLCLRALRMPLASGSVERLVVACGVGLSAVSLLTLGSGLAGWLSPVWLGGALLAAFMLEGGLCLRERRSRNVDESLRDSNSSRGATRLRWELLKGVISRGEQIPFALVAKSLAVVAMSLFLMAMLLGSLLPPTDFDVKAYHLTGPKEYFLNSRITFLEHNVYTNFPFLTEMLCLLGMVLRQDWYRGALAGQAVLMGFAPLTALALFSAGRRWFRETVGWLAAVIFLSTPWTYRLAIIAYVEGALSCYLFLTLFAVLLAVETVRRKGSGSESHRLYLLAGLFAGSAMACKYPGLVSVVIPLGLVSLLVVGKKDSGYRLSALGFRPERLWGALMFLIGTALTVGPWLMKNLLATGNPVYPLAFGIFGGRDWDAASHAKWNAGHSPATYAFGDLAEKFIDVTAKADWLSPLLFGLAPLAVLAGVQMANGRWQIEDGKLEDTAKRAASIQRSSSLIRWLWLYVAYLFAQWWLLTHRIDRFWVPLIPVVALLAAVGCMRSSSQLWQRACGAFVVLSVLFNLGFITTTLCGFNAYLSDLNKAREGAENTAEGIHYLNQLVEEHPMKPTVLCVGEAQVFDARMPVLYNTVFDHPILRDWLAKRPEQDLPDRDWPLRPIAEVREKFESAGVTLVLVNWQELLRYRRTYGYSDFVTPQRFRWLREQGLLGDPRQFGMGMRSFESLSDAEQEEVEQWAPELKVSWQGTRMFVTWQLFAVQTRRVD
ncbi:MAG: ArnT family glycosyltransferase [Planctomycetaceae bacterium]